MRKWRGGEKNIEQTIIRQLQTILNIILGYLLNEESVKRLYFVRMLFCVEVGSG